MHNVRNITEDLYWVGGNDRRLALFENIHPIPRGVSYNAYLLLDEKTVLIDTVDWSACRQYLENVEYLLDGRPLDYILIHHMEPDHGGSLEEILIRYPEAKVISSEKSFMIMRQFGFHIDGREIEVAEGDSFSFGKHTHVFVAAPMVHWPEVLVSYETTDKVLFSADAFGTFGSLDGKMFADEVNFDRDWIDDARRYYTNIVGKYGPWVMHLLGKAGGLDIQYICPLHGPVWRDNIGYFIDKHVHWASYKPEAKGVLIAYATMYGNTEAAAEALASQLVQKGVKNVEMYDVSSTDVSYLISETFRLSHLVLAAPTYNLEIYPKMHQYLIHMKDLHVRNRTVAIIENGSWAITSGDLMQKFVEEELKNVTVLQERLSIASAMHEDKRSELAKLADAIVESINSEE